MKHSKKWFGLGMILILLLATACGATGEEKSEPAAEAEPQTQEQRVVATSVTYPDFLYVLGVTPVAAENYHSDYPDYFEGKFDNVPKLGNGSNFEGILAVEPDVIIAPKWRDEKIYDQYAKIAKTVLLPDRDNWRDELKDMGEALGKQTEAEQAIQDYDTKIAAARDELKDLIGDETFIYLRIMPKESYVMGELSNRGTVIHKELGLKTVAAYPANEGSVPVSLELLTEYQADHIILQIDGGDDNKNAQKLYDEMKESNIWKGMKAVKEDHVYLVGDKEWMNFGYSSVATLNAVDDIVTVIRERNR
ncbi:ABC transporter substrate-binding protein [Paenibacillus sp. PCH8]|uniref:iron-siderophore ABC transporter substrate-binding protein n=1 Tax=Paenibacillus sp. PCH8 TaxID=2066524 RepID=UPI000CF991C2|nr:iron-siderophore ABC transporter substrate-binding protein [Paenibacillus sp. PCH8]PQP82405.1 ABC transporter substrate-binding protein [Paenibacillus sp. PCH8]